MRGAKGSNSSFYKEFKPTRKLDLLKQASASQREKRHLLEIFTRCWGITVDAVTVLLGSMDLALSFPNTQPRL